MNSRLVALAALFLMSLHPAHAHREDEYVQATFIAVENGQLRVDLFLTPGLNVLPTVLATIDADGNDSFSEAEQRDYARRVMEDLSFAMNGSPLSIELKQLEFPTPEQLRDGRGDIHFEFVVKLRTSPGRDLQLRFENRHHRAIAAYQVNCLMPRDASIRLGAPQRDPLQSILTVPITIGEQGPPVAAASLTRQTL